VSESTWWREELWWERGLFQLGGITISARQLGTLSTICVFALLASLPVNFALEGISFAGHFVAFGLIVAVGYFGLVTRKVRMVPIEMQVYYWLAKRSTNSSAHSPAQGPLTKSADQPERHSIDVDDFKNPVPFTFIDRVRVNAPTRVQLIVGGTVRDEAQVTPEDPGYRLMYIPRAEDIGVADGLLKLSGSDQTISRFRLTVSAKGVNLLEAREHTK
jgi:hypothetical protein